MKIENYIKWFCFAFLSLFLVACKPTANFTYSPTTPSTGDVVKFDATKSTVYKAKEGNAIAAYAWNFGDGSNGTGATIEHTYTKAGQYTVTLNVIDLAGQSNSTTQKVTVKQGTLVTQQISALVQSSDGTLLSKAKVTIQGQSAITDDNGFAKLNLSLAQNTEKVVVTFEKAGFISQSILVDVKDLTSLQASLLKEKNIIQIDNIEKAQVIVASTLGASIQIPENAFVIQSTGVLATGKVTVRFTPWDITGDDLNAMPANGIARDAKGDIVKLISAGMISAEFFDAQGNKLQLASGKTADIKMDLPITSLLNEPLVVGTSIPMWYFSEQDGLWLEEGAGSVVAEKDSKTGLAVQATVKHFSTWNWDKPVYLNEGGTAFVKCMSGATPIACNVSFTIEYKDGSRIAYKLNGGISDSGFLFSEKFGLPQANQINKVEWKGSNGILSGTAVSSTQGDQVTIQLGAPKSKNFIRCRLPDNTFTYCNVISDQQEYRSIPADGGTVISGSNVTSRTWTATASIYAGIQNINYEGTATSSAFDNVVIDLKTKSVPYMVQCKLTDGTPVGCDVKADNNIDFYARTIGQQYYLENGTDLNWQAKTRPVQENGNWVQYSGSTFKVAGNKLEITLNQKVNLGNLAKTIHLNCTCDVRVFVIPADSFNDWLNYNYFQGPFIFDQKLQVTGSETLVLTGVKDGDFVVFDTMYGDYGVENTPGIPYELLKDDQTIELPWDYSLYHIP